MKYPAPKTFKQKAAKKILTACKYALNERMECFKIWLIAAECAADREKIKAEYRNQIEQDKQFIRIISQVAMGKTLSGDEEQLIRLLLPSFEATIAYFHENYEDHIRDAQLDNATFDAVNEHLTREAAKSGSIEGFSRAIDRTINDTLYEMEPKKRLELTKKRMLEMRDMAQDDQQIIQGLETAIQQARIIIGETPDMPDITYNTR